jgi:ABC-type transport system involved in multi-copper enzyme maturation permease subunit
MMVVKELIEARWKAIICGLLALILVVVSAATYDLLKPALSNTSSQQMPQFLQQQLQLTSSYNLYVWGNWFSKNGTEILAVLAAVLGAGLIAGEVSKGTIFLLLGKPISRERTLLTKYAVSALILLAVAVLSSMALLVTAAIAGHPQQIGGVVISTLLLCLGELFVLGLALLFSVLFKDVLRPLLCALIITILTAIPGFIPNWSAWSLTGYWSSQAAYLGQEFPTKALIICLVAAVLPLVLALTLFRRQAY